MKFCPNCGCEIIDNTKFCTKCGAKLSDFSDEANLKENVVQRSQVGAASVGNINISPVIAPTFNVESNDSKLISKPDTKFLIFILLLAIIFIGVYSILIGFTFPKTISSDTDTSSVSKDGDIKIGDTRIKLENNSGVLYGHSDGGNYFGISGNITSDFMNSSGNIQTIWSSNSSEPGTESTTTLLVVNK